MPRKSTKDLEEAIRLARQAAWQAQLDGYTNASLRQIQAAITQAQAEITARLEYWAARPTPTGWSEQRSLDLLAELDAMSVGVKARLTSDIADTAGHAGSSSLEAHSRILSWDGKVVPFNAVALTGAQVRQLALETPVGGRLLQDWVGRAFDGSMQDGIRHEIMTGMLRGESYPDLIARVREGWDMTRTEAVTLTRTYVQSANVGAMESVYRANQDIVKGVKWCATLEIGGTKGGGTCLQCAVLDGREWAMGEPRPECPLHPRCRCVLLPVTKTWKELGLPIREMDEAYRPWTYSVRDIHEGRGGEIAGMGFHQGSFGDLFPRLPRATQLDIVGPGRMGLIESGEVAFADLVDDMGRLRLLERGPGGGWVGLKPPSGPGGTGPLPGMGGPLPAPPPAGFGGATDLASLSALLETDAVPLERMEEALRSILPLAGEQRVYGGMAERAFIETMLRSGSVPVEIWESLTPEVQRVWLELRRARAFEDLRVLQPGDMLKTGMRKMDAAERNRIMDAIRGLDMGTSKLLGMAEPEVVDLRTIYTATKHEVEMVDVWRRTGSVTVKDPDGVLRILPSRRDLFTLHEWHSPWTVDELNIVVFRHEGRLYQLPAATFDAERLAALRHLGFDEARVKVVDLDKIIAAGRTKLTAEQVVAMGSEWLAEQGYSLRNMDLFIHDLDAIRVALLEDRPVGFVLRKWTAADLNLTPTGMWARENRIMRTLGTLNEISEMTGFEGSTLRNVELKPSVRAYASKYNRKIVMKGSDVGGWVHWHEVGHHFEFESKAAERLATEYRASRATATATMRLSDIIKGQEGYYGKYGSNEVAFPSTFEKAYTAKYYSDGATEVISMGLQEFIDSYRMRDLARKDPEFFEFMVGLFRAKKMGRL